MIQPVPGNPVIETDSSDSPSNFILSVWMFETDSSYSVLRETFITRQPPKGENDDYDSENFWITGGIPSVGGGGIVTGGEKRGV